MIMTFMIYSKRQMMYARISETARIHFETSSVHSGQCHGFAFSRSDVKMTLLFKCTGRAIYVWFWNGNSLTLLYSNLFRRFFLVLFFLSLESFLSHNIFVWLGVFPIYSQFLTLELRFLLCWRSNEWNTIEFTVVRDECANFRIESNIKLNDIAIYMGIACVGRD